MSLLVTNAGDAYALKCLVNYTTPANLKLHLYTNAYTPTKADTTSSYTECALSGYAAVTLTGASWTVTTASNVTTASYPQQTFNFTASGTVTGYYITDNAGTSVIYAELFPSAYSVSSTQPLNVSLNVIAN